MSKELEALERRKQELINILNHDFEDDIYGTYRQLLQLKVENINLQMQIYNLIQPAVQKKLLDPMPPIYIKQALTTPTEEEVCKALSEFMNEPVWFDENKMIRISTQWLVKKVYYDDKYKGLDFQVVLPPHIVSIVSRFFEGDE